MFLPLFLKKLAMFDINGTPNFKIEVVNGEAIDYCLGKLYTQKLPVNLPKNVDYVYLQDGSTPLSFLPHLPKSITFLHLPIDKLDELGQLLLPFKNLSRLVIKGGATYCGGKVTLPLSLNSLEFINTNRSNNDYRRMQFLIVNNILNMPNLQKLWLCEFDDTYSNYFKERGWNKHQWCYFREL